MAKRVLQISMNILLDDTQDIEKIIDYICDDCGQSEDYKIVGASFVDDLTEDYKDYETV